MYDHNWCFAAAPPPLHEGMRFAVVQHTEVATWLSTLWATVSLAAQSILECLPVDAPQVGVMEEMVAMFWERAEWCSHLETSGLEVCDLVLGPTDGQAHLVAHLEEVAGQLRAMRDEHEALQSSANRVHGPVQGRSDETPPLAMALSPSMKLPEGGINVAAINEVQWGSGWR
jgi:hypothetical protein